jgi:hypothetical protein
MSSNTVSNICGTWVVESSENFDEFLKELGLRLILYKNFNSNLFDLTHF